MFSLFKNHVPFAYRNIKSVQRFSYGVSKNIPLKKFTMRPLKIFEFKKILNNWAVKEGWNPGKYDYLPFYLANINGHKGLFHNDRIVASLSAVRYSKDLAYLGIYIVDPNYREQGLGQILVKATLEELADCSVIAINAVEQQVPNYQRKYGFMPFHSILRMKGEFKVPNNSIFSQSERDIKIVGSTNIDLNALGKYDETTFLASRLKLLKNLIRRQGTCVLVAIINGEICGFGIMSECQEGFKISITANNKKIAQKLYISFADLHPGKQIIVQVDVPEDNQPAVELATQFGLYKSFKTTRMYRFLGKPLIEQPSNSNIYAYASLEIG